MTRRHATLAVAGLALAVMLLGGMPARTAEGIEVAYGPEEMLYGSCRPALTLSNRSGALLDYVQVDVSYTLRDGRRVMGEHKSRYRYGVESPISPGENRVLAIHNDESVPFGVPCASIKKARIERVICEAAGRGELDCRRSVRPGAGSSLALPRHR